MTTYFYDGDDDDPNSTSLRDALETVSVVTEMLSVEAPKGLLSKIADVLALTLMTTNEADYVEFGTTCSHVGITLWSAYEHTSTTEASPDLANVLEEFSSYVDTVYDEISTANANTDSDTSIAGVSLEVITSYKKEFESFIEKIRREAKIKSNLKISATSFAQERKRRSPKLPVLQGQPLPSIPEHIYGRDTLVEKTVESVLTMRHLGLSGPSGIGKTSVARMMVHHEAIADHFGARRHFIPFDDLHSSQIILPTFLHRVTEVIGLKTTQTNRLNLLCAYLRLGPTLLVFDGVDRLLQLPAGRQITLTFARLAYIPTVTIFLTTRHAALTESPFHMIPVGPLSSESARQIFSETSKMDVSPVVGRLLAAVEFHPSTIALLGHAARLNKWSPEQLLSAFIQHRDALMGVIYDLIPLDIAIEMLLASPFMKERGDGLVKLCRVLAAFPCGIKIAKSNKLLPSVLNLDAVIDALCQQSLAYTHEGFIRLPRSIGDYISRQYNVGPDFYADPVIADIRTHYYDLLVKHGRAGPGSPAHRRGEWIITEDLIVELLLTIDLLAPGTSDHCKKFAHYFILHLLWHHPRPTSLRVVFTLLPDPSPGERRDVAKHIFERFLAHKFPCIQAMIELSYLTGEDGVELSLEIYRLTALINHPGLAFKTVTMQLARAYITAGNYTAAEDLLAEATEMAHHSSDEVDVAWFNLRLGYLMVLTGDREGLGLMSSAQTTLEKWDDLRRACAAATLQGDSMLYVGDAAAARWHYEDERRLSRAMGQHRRLSCLLGLGDAMALDGRPEDANGIFEDIYAQAVKEQDWERCARVRAMQASISTSMGRFTIAKQQIRQAVKLLYLARETLSQLSFEWLHYIAGKNEMYAKRYGAAKELFMMSQDDCQATGNLSTEALATRALGEIACLEGDIEVAKIHFTEVRSVCVKAGISEERLNICHPTYLLKDDFDGWVRFKNDHL
ncbi:hypothetical protein DENSPDRAFT_842005 [Dentipellis sp. KUC8613]|nr:hypothetical protein DENSPDRAFT_842005 [Dentipellis sp. KUC8613]